MTATNVPDESLAEAPAFRPIGKLDDPQLYVPDPDTKRAVEVAVLLGLPLLVTGDPGSGKTHLAHWVAHQYGRGKPIEFHAKTTSAAQDLFYRYDSLGHFHASNFGREGSPAPDVMEFIYPQGLGLAILRALDPSHSAPFVRLKDDLHKEPRRSVVLIDEIDKAPRDFPNDVLDEIENMTFTVREKNLRVPASKTVDQAYRPIVILTSNSERNLPDAFLRRCAYLHIGRPNKKLLATIVKNRLDLSPALFTEKKVDEALELFVKIREHAGLKKRPGTAELLRWLHMMNAKGLDAGAIRPTDSDALFITCALLSKSREDEKRVKGFLGVAGSEED